MEPTLRIEVVDHRNLLIACQLHAVQMEAYAQEKGLLGALYFPPLDRTVEDVRSTDEVFLAVFVGERVVGSVSVCQDPEGLGMTIASLVVAPQFQRIGIGAALMASVLGSHGSGSITVQTGAKNVPALTLYAREGFIEIRRWFVGREPLELVKLLRPGVANSRKQ